MQENVWPVSRQVFTWAPSSLYWLPQHSSYGTLMRVNRIYTETTWFVTIHTQWFHNLHSTQFLIAAKLAAIMWMFTPVLQTFFNSTSLSMWSNSSEWFWSTLLFAAVVVPQDSWNYSTGFHALTVATALHAWSFCTSTDSSPLEPSHLAISWLQASNLISGQPISMLGTRPAPCLIPASTGEVSSSLVLWSGSGSVGSSSAACNAASPLHTSRNTVRHLNCSDESKILQRCKTSLGGIGNCY